MKIILSLILITLVNHTNAQQLGTLTGIVLNSKTKTPLPYTKVSLLKMSDSTLVTGALSDVDGSFKVDDIPYGKYIAKLTSFGFNTHFINDLIFHPHQVIINTGNVELVEDVEILNIIEVSAETAQIQTAIDKKIFNVEKNITATGGTALDALENVPSITIDMDGNVSLRGSSNVTILIDGRPSSITGGGRSGALSSIPASSIQNIEIITNPSAKYDPDGMSGIINIVLKKNKMKGFNGNVDAGIGTGINYNGSVNLAFKNEKLNIYGGYTINHYQGYRNFNQTRETWLNNNYNKLIQSREGTHLRHSNLFKFGTDFYLNDKSTLGFGITGNLSNNDRTGDMIYLSYDSTQLNNTWQRISKNPKERNGGDINVFYQRKFIKKNHKFTADANYSLGTSFGEGTYFDDSLDINGLVTFNKYEQQYNKTPSNNSNVNIQADYFYPLKKGKIETGLKTTIRTIEQSFYQESFNNVIQKFTEDIALTNTFNYGEQVHAGYLIYGLNFEKIKFQIGLRAEQVFVNAKIKEDTTNYNNDYFSLYPSAHIKKPLKNNRELSLSYSRRVNRPRMHSINPFPKYTDPLNLRKGNPYLNPEYINSVEFGYSSYSKKLTLNGSVFYRYMTDLIKRVKTIEANGVSVTSWQNLDEGHFVGLEGVVIYKPYKWWRIMVSTNLSQNYLKSDNTELNNRGFSWSARFSQTFSLKSNWSIQHSAFYMSPFVLSQGRSLSMYSTDIALKKSLFKKKLALSVKVSDIFNTRRFGVFVNSNQSFTQESLWKWQSRRIMFNVSYKFGKQSMPKTKRTRSGGGGDMGM